MSEHRAVLRANYGHPDIIAWVDKSFDASAAWLPDYFIEQVRSGVRFAEGQTIQVGWTTLKLAANSGGDLVVLEPDLVAMPVRWVEGASRCMRFLVLQRAICEEFGVEPDFPSLRQPASAPDPFAGANNFTMTRLENEASQSGWVFQQGTDAALRMVSLYEAALSNRAIIPFLALPSGSVVSREGNMYSVSAGGRHASSLSSDLLAKLGEAEAFSEGKRTA
jgi:hypothetical protein